MKLVRVSILSMPEVLELIILIYKGTFKLCYNVWLTYVGHQTTYEGQEYAP